ncbi:unnamed protein product [Arctia plantaginis]|uniref:RRM domain-containing protein n=1 Tax=Arctia plantaginis TaxID=874455 RepID=A0A8S1APZ1_ARCPL|nr:unnamed protein product [Arctia plantaginis]
MLLNIHNLPYTVTYNDIKSLIYSKCGIADVILDNLVPHENRTKKVTVGLSGEEDAAIFTKNIDGAVMKGHQLRVVSKPKIPTLSQPGPSDTIQSHMPQESAYSQGQNYTSSLQNVPTMVPPPPLMNYGTPNMFYPNQSAFYMMNQSTYPSTSSLPNIGYQTVPYGNAGNQGYAQGSWSDNTWNQQQQSEGSQNSPPKKEREVSWDKGDSKSNGQSQWDNSNTNWGTSNTNWGNSKSKWENSNFQKGNNNSPWENNPTPDRDNRRQSSTWNNSSGDSSWNSHNDPRSNNSRDSNWQNSRASNHDNTYRSNPRAGTSRDRDSPNRQYNRNYSPRPSENIYGDHVRHPSQDKRPRDNESQQNRFKCPPRQRSPNDRDPRKRERNTQSGNVPHDSTPVHRGSDPLNQRAIQLGRMWRGQFIATKARNIMEDPRFEYDAPNHSKLLAALTSNIKRRVRVNFDNDYSMPMNQLEKKYNKIYGFHGDWVVLRDSLQKVGGRLLSKVDAGGDTNIPCKTIKKNKKGGVFDNMSLDDRNEPEEPLGAGPQQGNVQQVGLQYGGQPQASTSMIGNILQGPPQQRKPQHGGPPQQRRPELGGPPQQRKTQLGGPPRAEFGSQFKKAQQGGTQQRGPRFGGPPQTFKFGNKNKGKASKQAKNPSSIPLALIPGRIPHYPEGDKKLNTQHKKDAKDILMSDLSSPMFNKLELKVKNAIDKEVNLLCTMIDKVCENPGKDPIPANFLQFLKGDVSAEMRRVFKVMLARRILPILPTMLRVYASPPIKRVPLENFLKNFKVSALKKSKQNAYYVVHCNSIEDHDKLCQMKEVLVADSLVSFKPLHLINARKMPKNNTRPIFLFEKELAQNTEKKDIIKGVPKTEDVNAGYDNEEMTTNEVEEHRDDDNMDKGTADAVQDKDDLCEEMKNIYEQINNTEANDNEENQTHDNEEYKGEVEPSNEEAFQAFQSVQVTDSEDFTNDVDIDNIIGNLSEETNNKSSAQEDGENEHNVDETNENQQDEENIDMADVNEEDLEDW